MPKQISTAVDELVHAAFCAKASEEGITPYRLLNRLIHEHLGVIDTKGAHFEAHVFEIYKALDHIKIGESVHLNDISKLVTFKATEWEIRSALMKAFLSQADNSWKRIVDKDGKIPTKSKFYAVIEGQRNK